MIALNQVGKKFDDIYAVKDLSIELAPNKVYGFIGTNGSGKSTLFRMISGIFESDEGQINIDGAPVYENIEAKAKIGFVPDNNFYYAGYKINDLANLHKRFYASWDQARYERLLEIFDLPLDKPISQFSKGMKRQVAMLLGFSISPKYLILDETFDGVDAVMKKLVCQLIVEGLLDYDQTVLLSSHNLREVQDICDRVFIMHKGAILADVDVENMNETMCKAQIAFRDGATDIESLGLQPKYTETNGVLKTIIFENSAEEVREKIYMLDPLIFEIIPLTLEEYFLHELAKEKYDITNILS